MEIYNRFFEINIKQKLSSFDIPEERLEFLIREKDNFISLNRNNDADQIIKRFDSLIELEKIKLTTNPPLVKVFVNENDKARLIFRNILKVKPEDRDNLIMFLKKEFPKGKNKEAAIMVVALIENKILIEPTVRAALIKAIKDEWKTEFEDENFNKAFRDIINRKTIHKKEYKGEVVAAIEIVREYLVGNKLAT